jgi:hypothetical protein
LGGDGVVAGAAARFPFAGMVVLDCAVKPQTRGEVCSLRLHPCRRLCVGRTFFQLAGATRWSGTPIKSSDQMTILKTTG